MQAVFENLWISKSFFNTMLFKKNRYIRYIIHIFLYGKFRKLYWLYWFYYQFSLYVSINHCNYEKKQTTFYNKIESRVLHIDYDQLSSNDVKRSQTDYVNMIMRSNYFFLKRIIF